MAEAAKTEMKTILEALSPGKLAEAQKHSSAIFTEANELLLKTARALWESQMELFRLKSEHAAKAFVPLKAGENPAAVFSEYYDHQRERVDQMITHMRKSNDLAMDFGWQLLAIYTRGFQHIAQDAQLSQQTGRSGKV